MLIIRAKLITPKKGDYSQLKQIKNNVLNIYYNLYQVIKHYSAKIELTYLLGGWGFSPIKTWDEERSLKNGLNDMESWYQ